jgi:hypothetical protein
VGSSCDPGSVKNSAKLEAGTVTGWRSKCIDLKPALLSSHSVVDSSRF